MIPMDVIKNSFRLICALYLWISQFFSLYRGIFPDKLKIAVSDPCYQN